MESNGKFVSHVVRKPRRKLDLEEKRNNDERNACEDGLLHVEVPIHKGKKLRLRLSKNTKFIAPGLVIEKEGKIRQFNPDCHYQGQIIDQPNSSVSISYCQGLVSPGAFFVSYNYHLSKLARDYCYRDGFSWCDTRISVSILCVVIVRCTSRRAEILIGHIFLTDIAIFITVITCKLNLMTARSSYIRTSPVSKNAWTGQLSTQY